MRFADKELRRLLDHLIEVSLRQQRDASTRRITTLTDERHRSRKRRLSRDLRDPHIRFALDGVYVFDLHSIGSVTRPLGWVREPEVNGR
jgi:hypothetical protein